MGAIGRSFRIFNESLAVLKKDKEILLFPVLSGLFCILALAGTVFGAWHTGIFGFMFDDAVNGSGGSAQIVGLALVFAWYFVTWFIVVFFNVAVVACAKKRFEGGDPTLGDGFSAGFSNLGRIAAWAFVSACVGILLDMVERIRGVGQILRWILGAAWGLMTYFVVPVMIFEKTGPFASIRASKDLLKKTWGESLVASGGMGLVFFLLAIPAAGLPYLFGKIGVLVMLAWFLVLIVLGSAMGGIYRTALYLYARTGVVPEGMDEFAIRQSFAHR
jgi:hypothetical protein